MQGTVRGNDGSSVKGREGRTHFDCQKWKKKPKMKISGHVFLETGGVLGRVEGTAVVSEARRIQPCVQKCKNKFFSENGYTGTAEQTE